MLSFHTAPLHVSLRWAQCRSGGCIAESQPLILLGFFESSADPTAGAKYYKDFRHLKDARASGFLVFLGHVTGFVIMLEVTAQHPLSLQTRQRANQLEVLRAKPCRVRLFQACQQNAAPKGGDGINHKRTPRPAPHRAAPCRGSDVTFRLYRAAVLQISERGLPIRQLGS